MDFDLIVVGGGPAGMLGAAAAGAKGLKVILLEKNDRLGKKLSLTGNGRCNVTNCGDFEDYQNHIVNNKKFLYTALRVFDSRSLTGLLQGLGLRTRVEDRGRVFPASNSAGDVIKALQKYLEQNRVEVRLRSEVERVLAGNGRVQGVLLRGKGRVSGRNVLIARGGMSYWHTGSTGDGHRMALELGHNVAGPSPALIPLVTGEPWVKGLQGLSLKDVLAQVGDGKRSIAKRRGDLLFTHFGVSGPVILDLSSFLTREPRFPLDLKVDLLHGLTGPQVEERLQRLFAENPGKSLKNVLSASPLAPQRLVPVLLELSGVESGKQAAQVNRKERELLARVMKNLTLTVLGTRPLNEAIVTGGGIDIREINPSTLESKIMAGLYFAGEILDTDALTGGYNLQIAFSTGYLSGSSAARERSGRKNNKE
jgi:predicted Rossmann fold flavoprotein